MSSSLEELVIENLERGFLCSESVIKASAEYMGASWDRIPAIATGLGGGIGITGDICGALTGAVLALGLAYGRSTPDQDPFPCAIHVQELVEQFQKRFGSVNCPDIIGIDLRTEEGRDKATAKGLLNLPCKDSCVLAARYLAGAIPAGA